MVVTLLWALLHVTAALSIAEHGQKTITVCKTITDRTPLMVTIIRFIASN